MIHEALVRIAERAERAEARAQAYNPPRVFATLAEASAAHDAEFEVA